MATRQTECAKGHNDWYTNEKTGYRQCRTCNIERMNRWRLIHRTPKNQPLVWADWRHRDRGPRFDALTYSEVMRARGYVDSEV